MVREQEYHNSIDNSFIQASTKIGKQNLPETKKIFTKPFLKWVGSKRSILQELIKRLPREYTKYHEPFIGGGALFFEAQPKNAHISDVNFHLAITYRAIRDNVDDVIKQLKTHSRKHNKEYFLKVRDELFDESNPTKIAGYLIYLNKTCFNGLYRVNKTGKFNAPMGDYKNPAILDEENLRNVSEILQGIDIYQQPFNQIKIEKGAFYYLDPPYHKTYSQYDGSGFGDEEHEALAEFCKKIDKVGGYFMLSNSNTEFVKDLYEGYAIEQVSASRTVSCKANQRKKENEIIVRNYE